MPSLRGAFGFFLTWWGAFLLGVLDSSLLVFLPFGIDAVVIYLAARSPERFWLYAVMTTTGSTLGALGTYWIGRKVGEIGLERFVSGARLNRVRRRVRTRGAVAVAVPALMPPPFPLTAFVLACGALHVDLLRFVVVFSVARLVRFGGEALLARRFGSRLLQVLESDVFLSIVSAFVAVVVIGTVWSAVILWRRTRTNPQRA